MNIFFVEYCYQKPTIKTNHSGSILKILRKQDDGWWFAVNEISSKQGLIPSNYVEEIQNGEANNESDTASSSEEEYYEYPDAYKHPDIVPEYGSKTISTINIPTPMMFFYSTRTLTVTQILFYVKDQKLRMKL